VCGEAGTPDVNSDATLYNDGFAGGIERIQMRRCKSPAVVNTTLQGVEARMENNRQRIIDQAKGR